MTMNKDKKDAIRTLYKGLRNVVTGEYIPDGTPVVIKAISLRTENGMIGLWSEQNTNGQKIRKRQSIYQSYLFTWTREAAIHKALVAQKPLTVLNSQEGHIIIKPTDIAPQFFFAGSSRDGGVYIIVMERVLGKQLGTIMKEYALSSKYADVVAEVEKTVMALAAFGYEHGDLHYDNIMILKNGDAKVIDFGLSIPLPYRLIRKMIRAIHESLSTLSLHGEWDNSVLNDVYHFQGISEYSNSRMIRRGYEDFYNPSYKSVDGLKTLVNKQELNEARRNAWGLRKIERGRKHNTRYDATAAWKPSKLNYGNL